jgi:hypothetical protein
LNRPLSAPKSARTVRSTQVSPINAISQTKMIQRQQFALCYREA